MTARLRRLWTLAYESGLLDLPPPAPSPRQLRARIRRLREQLMIDRLERLLSRGRFDS